MANVMLAEYADHANTAANVLYDDDSRKYVSLHSNSKHKRELDAWMAEGNEIQPCPLLPGANVDNLSTRIDALEVRVAELELINGVTRKKKSGSGL